MTTNYTVHCMNVMTIFQSFHSKIRCLTPQFKKIRVITGFDRMAWSQRYIHLSKSQVYVSLLVESYHSIRRWNIYIYLCVPLFYFKINVLCVEWMFFLVALNIKHLVDKIKTQYKQFPSNELAFRSLDFGGCKLWY